MRASVNYMPPEQFADLIGAIPTLGIRKWKNTDVVMLFKICYWCGLRINEALRLQVSDFDIDMRRVYLGMTKTKKGDKATIPETFVSELRAWLLTRENELFRGMNYAIVYNWLIRLGKQLGIKALTTPQKVTGEKTKTHIFRKSVGKDMVYGTRDGKRQPLNVVQKKLRHTTLDMTTRYLQVEDEDVASAGW